MCGTSTWTATPPYLNKLLFVPQPKSISHQAEPTNVPPGQVGGVFLEHYSTDPRGLGPSLIRDGGMEGTGCPLTRLDGPQPIGNHDWKAQLEFINNSGINSWCCIS
ncbi:unnamed protein product [Boreogadus saida]